jgi:hypothetical protein
MFKHIREDIIVPFIIWVNELVAIGRDNIASACIPNLCYIAHSSSEIDAVG